MSLHSSGARPPPHSWVIRGEKVGAVGHLYFCLVSMFPMATPSPWSGCLEGPCGHSASSQQQEPDTTTCYHAPQVRGGR